MRLITLTAPSKTFLVGEYIALSGGPTLILNTQPRFELTASISENDLPSKQQGIRIHSPAGKFIKLFQQQFLGNKLSFKDPHKGTGGFGASSAQFAMVLALEHLIKNQRTIKIAIPSVLQFYAECSWSGNGPSPSGADVIAQMVGKIAFYHNQQQQLEQLSWPFENIDFCLIRTGQKIATHQHLATLSTNAINNSELIDVSLQTFHAIKTNKPHDFIKAVQQYGVLLDNLGLVAAHTQQMLQQINKFAPMLTTKGCGALGADVILIIFESSQRDALLEWLQQQSFNIAVFGREQLCDGILCSDLTNLELEY